MSDHDPYCRCSDPSWSNPVHCTCEKIRMIRADERQREALRGPSTAWYDAHERAVLADLRARVDAMRTQVLETHVDTDRTPRLHGALTALDEVLALIDGGRDE